MDEGKFGNIEIKKMYPIEDCLFYIIGKSLTDEDVDGINTIKAFENKLDGKGINCIKIYTKEERIFYRPANDKEGEQEIKKDSNEFSDLCLKLFEDSKEFLMPNPTNTNSSGLPTILIKEYAKRQTGKPVNYIEANIDGDSSCRPCPPIYVRKIECNKNTIQRPINFFKSLVPVNELLKTYILGTPTHVSSFMVQDNGIFYLFDTTGHTHQTQKASKTKPQVQLQQGLKSQTQQIQQSQEQRNKVLYYTSELTLDKEEMPLSPNNGQEGQQQGSGNTIQPVSLNPFGLDYQNGSSACGIWTVNVLVVASTYESIKDFIIKDEEEDYVAMFKSEFILKVSAEVAKELSVNPEVKILKQEETLPEGYCKCKVGNTLFAINTTYNVGSCLNMKNVLLSVSQKELEFYNDDNNINNEIIERRKQLIERIKIEKTKCEKVINIIREAHTAMPEKTKQQGTAKESAKTLLMLKISGIKATEPFKKTKLELDELETIKSKIAELKKTESEMAELRMAELEQVELKITEQEKIELERIKSNIVELNEVESSTTKLKKAIQSRIAELKQIESEMATQKIDELKKAEQKIYKLESTKRNILNLEKVEIDKINSNTIKFSKIESNITELKQIKSKIIELENAKQEADQQETNKLEKINENIAKLKEDEEKKQSDCYSVFIEYFMEILNIKNLNIKDDDARNNNNKISCIIGGIELYCKEQIKIIDSQLNHAQKVDELFIRYKGRQNEQINQFQQNNTKSQKSDYSIGPR